MLIDWFTVGAQAFNFIILVWLLKRYLYKPVLDAVDARDKKIAEQLQDAKNKQAEAQKERDDFQHKNEEFQQQRQALLDKATREAQTQRTQLLESARIDSQNLRAKLQQTLDSERAELGRELTSRAQNEIFAIARKTLTDLADSGLEEQMTTVFIRRLSEFNAAQKADLKVPPDGVPPIVLSAYPLPQLQQNSITQALQEILGAPPQFHLKPDLVSGLELNSNGHKVGWNSADYLTEMAKSVDDLLKAKTLPALASASAAEGKPSPSQAKSQSQSPAASADGRTASAEQSLNSEPSADEPKLHPSGPAGSNHSHTDPAATPPGALQPQSADAALTPSAANQPTAPKARPTAIPPGGKKAPPHAA